MPTATYTPLATITLGTAAQQVVFASIPQTFRDLILVIGGSASGDTSPSLRFNGSTGNTSVVRMFSNSGSSNSQTLSDNYISIGFMNTTQSTTVAHILDYAATDKFKPVIGRGGTTSTIRMEVGRWNSTTAITSLSVGMDGSQTYSIGTTISLYGVAA